jgi:hypothetical protein
LLLKVALQLCFGLDAVDRINTTEVFCDLGGLLIPILGGEKEFSAPLLQPFLDQHYYIL